MLKVTLTDGNGLMRYPRSAVSQIFDTFGLPSNNKLFSCNFNSRKKEVIRKYKKSEFSKVKIIAIELVLYSPNFSEFYRNTQSVKLHNTIQRSLGLGLSAEAFGYCLYFDMFEKAMRSTFYFVNEDNDGRTLFASGISRKNIAALEEKIDKKTVSYPHTSRNQDILRTYRDPDKGDVVEVIEPPLKERPSGELAQVLFDFSVSMTDPMVNAAIQRALKGLDYERASDLLSVFNKLIEHNGDPSINPIELPKKHANSKWAKAPESHPVDTSEGVLDIFDL
ncbi:hypothetical protein [Vibrio sp. D431a]|uniref:hypothetical protein n=1 Tax=Vibrio sp. D431a TaxID=2837388 RepID=UPI002555169D|nr:hypothetical protein [Vibrio sp. D431a]MDK9790606.1 hypothetical protein [Vibrio sp. D431a]